MSTPNTGIVGVRVAPLSSEESALQGGANLVVELTHECLTEAAANTAQTIALFDVGAKINLVSLTRAELVVPFENTADAAFNTTPIIVGDDGDTARFLVSMEINVNGTEVIEKGGVAVQYNYTAANTVDIVFGSMAAKSLVDINKGKLRLFFRLFNALD